jgi:hypothetical protein
MSVAIVPDSCHGLPSDSLPSPPTPSPDFMREGAFACAGVLACGSLLPSARGEGLGMRDELLDGRLDLFDEGVERLLGVGAAIDVL